MMRDGDTNFTTYLNFPDVVFFFLLANLNVDVGIWEDFSGIENEDINVGFAFVLFTDIFKIWKRAQDSYIYQKQ